MQGRSYRIFSNKSVILIRILNAMPNPSHTDLTQHHRMLNRSQIRIEFINSFLGQPFLTICYCDKASFSFLKMFQNVREAHNEPNTKLESFYLKLSKSTNKATSAY